MIKDKVTRELCQLIVNELPNIVKSLELPEEFEYRVVLQKEDEKDPNCLGCMRAQIKQNFFGVVEVNKESLFVYIYVDSIVRFLKRRYSPLLLLTPYLGNKIINYNCLETLAHEYRHMWQYYTGWVTKNGLVDDLLPYEWRAKERDAREFAKKYLKGGE